MEKKSIILGGLIFVAILVVSIPLLGLIVRPDMGTVITMQTTKGDIKIELFDKDAPITVQNFLSLIEKDFYDGIIFHRVISGFMIQGGCPLGTGMGGSGQTIPCEFISRIENNRGTLSMANAGPNTGSSQFFINLVDNPHLNGRHTVFGRVIEGMDVVDAIGATEVEGERPVVDVVIKDIIKNSMSF